MSKAVSQIVSAVFETSARPELRAAPRHSSVEVLDLCAGLTRIDNLVFAAVCRAYVMTGERFVEPAPLYDELQDLDVSADQLNESLEILDHHGYLRREMVIGGGCVMVEVDRHQADEYVRHEIPEYAEVVRGISSAIVNLGARNSDRICEETGAEAGVVNHVLAMLQAQDLIQISEYHGGGCHIYNVSAVLRRSLQR